MDLIKYFERLETMDNLIRRKSTGTPAQFASKLDVSRSTLMDYLKLLRELNAPIKYDNLIMSYFYLFPCEFKIGYESRFLTQEESLSVNRKSLKKFCESALVQK